MKNKELVYFFFLLIFVLCLILTLQKHPNFKYSLIAEQKQDQDQQEQETSFFYQIQLKDGVPLIKIKLGSNGSQRVIVDTGSALLNVAHRNCIGCSKTNGTYNGEIDDQGDRQMIFYGSQHDTVARGFDHLQLKQEDNSYKQVKVPFFTTLKRSRGEVGASDSNVMGFLRDASESDNISQYILPHGYCLVINLSKSQKFIAGYGQKRLQKFKHTLQTHSQLHSVPFVNHYSLPYYVVEVKLLRCGEYSTRNISHCIVDTGSNMSSFSKPVYKQILMNIRKTLRPEIEIVFANGRTLVMDRANIFWQGTADPMIDDDTQILGRALQDTTCILGCFALNNRCLFFEESTFSFTSAF